MLNPALLRRTAVLAACVAALLLGGCPEPPADSQDPDPEAFTPSAPIPGDNPLTQYGKLWLGMSALDISQEYNAPQGTGEGFSRVIEDFGAVQNHLIEFNPSEETPQKKRRMVLRMYRDVLCVLVERREGLTADETEAWRQELISSYGEDFSETVSGAQWSWGDPGSVLLTFTQDNGPEGDINANVVLEHKPTLEASRNYAQAYERVHPSTAE